jgi:RHS repeat-associated protein
MGVPLAYTNTTGAEISPPSFTQSAFPGQMKTLPDLYYNRYRDYDPSTGRYIQADPIGLAGDPNPYAYAMNNPLRYSDPEGLEKVILFKEWGMWAASLFEKDRSGFCTIYSHGSAISVAGMNGDNLAKYLRKNGVCKDNQPIILNACRTGERPDGVAQQLADAMGVPVYAPDTYVWYRPYLGISGIYYPVSKTNKIPDTTRPGKTKLFIPKGTKQ